jgi:hypothetical protein
MKSNLLKGVLISLVVTIFVSRWHINKYPIKNIQKPSIAVHGEVI